MLISTTRFGEIEIDPDTLITFPDGIPGFEECTRFKLFHEEGEELVHWLQSVDHPDLGLSLADPAQFEIYYEFALSEEEEAKLQLEDFTTEAAIFLVLYRPDEKLPAGHIDPELKGDVRANARSPLILNLRKRIGIQKPLSGPVRQTLIRETGE